MDLLDALLGAGEGLRGRRGCCRVEIGRSGGSLGGLCGGREGFERGLGLPAGEIKVVVCVGHVGELGFRHAQSRSGGAGRSLPGV